MPNNPVNVGAAGNDHSGDPLRDAFIKINAMFAELQLGLTVKAGEILSARDPVYLAASGSPPVLYMFKADATDTTKPATGMVGADVGSGVDGVFIPLGLPLSSSDSPAPFVMGTRYWVAVGGGLTNTMPTTTLNGQQEVAFALSDSVLLTYLKPMNEAP
jgi:hypothetical protein